MPLLLRLVVLVALLALPAAAAAAQPPRPGLQIPAYGLGALKSEWLVGYNGVEGLDPNGVADLDRMRDANIGIYRARFRQDRVLSGGTYSEWVQLDNLVRHAALRNVTIQPVLINMPLEVYAPPRTAEARSSFAAFAEAAVRRYGPKGSFWGVCGCPKRAIQAWEVWNEPNIAPFWETPNTAEYAALLDSTRTGLRRADRGARVLFGGLAYPSSYSSTRLEPNEFLRQVIAAVGANKFDAVPLHLYKADPVYAVDTLIAGTAQVLAPYGHQLWVNEFGRPTQPDDPNTATNEQATSEEAQRAWEVTFLDRLLAKRSAWNVGPVMWYSLRDSHAATASWQRQGLRRTNSDDTDAGAKPSWDAYLARSIGAAPLALPPAR